MKESFQPLVSIVIPVYNGSNYLAQAIDSALTQTYPHVEVIVVNDGSSDNGATDAVARGYGGKIRYYTKPNGGAASALNYGIERMRGDYFSWLSHDDLYEPHKVEESVRLLPEREDERIVALCGTQLVDKDGRNIPTVSRDYKSRYTGYEMFCYSFSGRRALNGCALLIPRKAFEELGYFAPLVYLPDADYWARLMVGGYRFVVSTAPLVKMRVHAAQVTNRIPQKYYEEFPLYVRRIYDRISSLAEGKELFLRAFYLGLIQGKVRTKELEKLVEKQIHVSWNEKLKYRLRGRTVQILKSVYHVLFKK